MVICLERGADLHMAQQIPLLLTVSCFSKIQIGFTFLVPAHPGSPGQRAVKRVCVCVCIYPLMLCLQLSIQEKRRKVTSTFEPSDEDVMAGYMSILQPQRESKPQQEQQL